MLAENSLRILRLTLLPLLSFSSAAAFPFRGTVASQVSRQGESVPSLNWQSPARLRQGLRKSPGTLIIDAEAIQFRSAQGLSLHWPFVEVQTFDLLTPRRLVIKGYENRGRHRPGEKVFRLELDLPVPPAVAAALAERIGKPVRNGVPDPGAPSLATIPARHPTRTGGSNGVLRFRTEGIDYISAVGRDSRSWRWSDIYTLAHPDAYHLRVGGYRETFGFELKQPMSRELFDRLWDRVFARDLNVLSPTGGSRP